MKRDFDYVFAKIKVMDFTQSVERLANNIKILSTYYDFCIEDYEEFWRLNSLFEAVMGEYDTVMREREEVRSLFLD